LPQLTGTRDHCSPGLAHALIEANTKSCFVQFAAHFVFDLTTQFVALSRRADD
jgi:hypothetical protein